MYGHDSRAVSPKAFVDRPAPWCNGPPDLLFCDTGQLTYATAELREAHGFPASDAEIADLLMGPAPPMLMHVDEISNSFWSQTKWGAAMQDQLTNNRFRRSGSRTGLPIRLF